MANDTSRDILMETADTEEAALVMKRAYANVLVKFGLAGIYGVYVAIYHADPSRLRKHKMWAVYLGRHDDKPMPRSELDEIQRRLS